MRIFLNFVKKLLNRSQIFRSIALLSGGTAIAQLISIVALPFITRLYTPSEIGIASLFLAFLGFWLNTIALRYEHALVIAADDAESHILHRLAMVLVILMSFLGMTTLFFLQFAGALEFQKLPIYTPLVAFPILVAAGLSLVYRSWALRAGLVTQLSEVIITRSAVLSGTKISLGILGGGVVGLLIAELMAALTSQIRLMRATVDYFAASRPVQINFSKMKYVGSKFSKFPKVEMPSAWLDSLSMILPLPLVASLYGVEAAGWFGLARMVVSLPNAQIGAAVADVFQIELAKAVREKNYQRSHNLFFSLLKKMSWIGLIPLTGTILILPWAFPFVFGSSWEPAGWIAASLAPWLYAAFIVSPLSRALSVLQAQEWKFFYDATALVLIVACYFLSKVLMLTVIEFCLLVSMAQVIGYVVYAVILFMLVDGRLKNYGV